MRTSLAFGRADASEFKGQRDIREHVSPGQQARFLEDQTDARLDPSNGRTEGQHVADFDRQQSIDDAQQCRLAAPVGPDDGHDLLGGDAQVDAIEDGQARPIDGEAM